MDFPAPPKKVADSFSDFFYWRFLHSTSTNSPVAESMMKPRTVNHASQGYLV